MEMLIVSDEGHLLLNLGGYYLVDWTTGLDSHTFSHSEVTFVISLLTKCLHGTFYPLLNEDHSMILVILLHEWNLIV